MSSARSGPGVEPNANVPCVNLVDNSLYFFFPLLFILLFLLENLNFALYSCYCMLIANMLVFIISSFVFFNLCFCFRLFASV